MIRIFEYISAFGAFVLSAIFKLHPVPLITLSSRPTQLIRLRINWRVEGPLSGSYPFHSSIMVTKS